MQPNDALLAKQLARSVRRARVARRWSQAELAERVDVSTHYIGLIERGLRLPSMPAMVRLAQALGRSVDGLLGLVTVEQRDPWAEAAAEAFDAVSVTARPTVLAMLLAASKTAAPKSESGVRVRRRSVATRG